MTPEQLEARHLELLKQEEGNPLQAWWLSFVDTNKPVGQRGVGVIITIAPGFIHALEKTRTLGINPGGEVKCFRVENIDPQYYDRLLTGAQLKEADLI